MSEEVAGNGAPYNILVTFPNNNKEETYKCSDKETTLTDLTTLVLRHINENIRGSTGVRMVFEVVSAPVPVPETKEEEIVEDKRPKRNGKVGDVHVAAVMPEKEKPDGTVDGAAEPDAK